MDNGDEVHVDVPDDFPPAFDVRGLIEEIQRAELGQDTVRALWRCIRPARDGILRATVGTKLVNGESTFCDTTTMEGSPTSTTSVEVQAMPDVISRETQLSWGDVSPKLTVCSECKKKVKEPHVAESSSSASGIAEPSGGSDGSNGLVEKKEPKVVLCGGPDGVSRPETKPAAATLTIPVDDVMEVPAQKDAPRIEKPEVLQAVKEVVVEELVKPQPASSLKPVVVDESDKRPAAPVKQRKDTSSDDSDIELIFDALPTGSKAIQKPVVEPKAPPPVAPVSKDVPLKKEEPEKEVKIKDKEDKLAEEKEPKGKKEEEQQIKKKKHKKHKDKGKEKKKDKDKKKNGEKEKKKADKTEEKKPEEKDTKVEEKDQKVKEPQPKVKNIEEEREKNDHQSVIAVDDFSFMKVVPGHGLKMKLERAPSGDAQRLKPKLTDEELRKKHGCRPCSLKLKKLTPELVEKMKIVLKKYARQQREKKASQKEEKFKALLRKREKKKERERMKLKKVRRIESSSDEEEGSKKKEEVRSKRVRSSSDSSDNASVKSLKTVKPKLVAPKPVKRPRARSSEDSSDDDVVIEKEKKKKKKITKPPSRPASSSSFAPPRSAEPRNSSSDSSDDEAEARKKKTKILSAVNEKLKKLSHPAPSAPVKVVEKRKEPPSVPAEPAAKKPKVEEEKKPVAEKLEKEKRPSPPSSKPPTPTPPPSPSDPSGVLKERPATTESGLNDVLARIVAEENAKPEFKLKAWQSKDEKENEDINHPEWQQLKQIKTEKERYEFVRKDWKTDCIPNANICRTYLSKRTREVVDKPSTTLFTARPGLVDPEVARVSLGDLQNSRFNHTYNPVEDLRRLPKVMPSYHFDYFWMRMNWRLREEMMPKQMEIERKKEKIDKYYRPMYESEVLPRERGKIRRIWDDAKKPLDLELSQLSKKLSEPFVEIYARFFKARVEGLEWEAFYTGLPEATFTSLELSLNQFLNLERFHMVAYDYRKFYGSVTNETEGVVRDHTLQSCAYCAKVGRAYGRV